MEEIVEFEYVDANTGLVEQAYEIKETGLRFFDYLELLNFLKNM